MNVILLYYLSQAIKIMMTLVTADDDDFYII